MGRQGEHVAEFTRFGWTIMALGNGVEFTEFLAVKSNADYDRLCTLDMLRLEDSPHTDQVGGVKGILRAFNPPFDQRLVRDQPEGEGEPPTVIL